MSADDLISEGNRISDRLRACATVEEVDQVAQEERATVMRMKGQEGTVGGMFYNIAHLKRYMISEIKRGSDGP